MSMITRTSFLSKYHFFFGKQMLTNLDNLNIMNFLNFQRLGPTYISRRRVKFPMLGERVPDSPILAISLQSITRKRIRLGREEMKQK